MPLIRPFLGLRPVPEKTAEVIAPPYDVVTASEARARSEGKPWSFLHISRPEIDLAPDTDPYSETVYEKGRENFSRQIREGILQRESKPCYYLYRIVMGQHHQIGLVAVASLEDYRSNRIRKHEFTRPVKENDRMRQIDALNAQTGPVLLTYRHTNEIDEIVVLISGRSPDIEVTADDAVEHTLWVVRDPIQIERLTQAFEGITFLYIADGHHRSAAASRVAEARRTSNARHTGEEAYNYFLTIIFPDDQMQILPYNRAIKDLNGLSQEEFIERLKEKFNLKSDSQPVSPGGPGEFGMYLPGQWFRLALRPEHLPSNDPVAGLDVSLLADFLISPFLGVTDPRRDKRIDFIGGIRGLKELERCVDSKEMAVSFSIFPTTLPDLMAVADAGKVMPPKSTWFEPKLVDGLVSHVLD